MVAETGGSTGEIGPRRVPLKKHIPVVQCELPSMSETPPPPFWPEKGKKNPGDRSAALPSWDDEGGRGGGVIGGEGGGKRGGEGRRMRAEGYSAPSGGYRRKVAWVGGISWDSVFRRWGGVALRGFGALCAATLPPPRYSVCATARRALRCWCTAACVGVVPPGSVRVDDGEDVRHTHIHNSVQQWRAINSLHIVFHIVLHLAVASPADFIHRPVLVRNARGFGLSEQNTKKQSIIDRARSRRPVTKTMPQYEVIWPTNLT